MDGSDGWELNAKWLDAFKNLLWGRKRKSHAGGEAMRFRELRIGFSFLGFLTKNWTLLDGFGLPQIMCSLIRSPIDLFSLQNK